MAVPVSEHEDEVVEGVAEGAVAEGAVENAAEGAEVAVQTTPAEE
jgi:hypothetical protein